MITLHSVHGYDTEQEDCLEFTTDGLYTFDGDTGCMSYMESEVTGMEGTRTSIMVLPDKVVLDRDGMITSRMVFQPGQKNSVLYDTPYGTATLSILTRSINQSFNKDGGKVEIDYVLDVEHAVATRNRFQLSVKKQKTTGDQPYV